MKRKVNDTKERQKFKAVIRLCCFWGFFIIILTVVPLMIWFYVMISPEETLLVTSYSPNDINKIEIVRIDELPDPMIKINYADQSIVKTQIPHDINVEWMNDYEADVVFDRQEIIPIKFEVE